MTNKFKKGDNVKIRRDQTGGVWQVKEVKERECDKGHPETRFIYLCEEVDSKHQQWIKEERLDKCRSGIQLLIDEIESNREYFHKLLDVKFTYSSGTDGICAGALAELERASHKSWHTTSTNEIKVEDEPKFKVGDWVRCKYDPSLVGKIIRRDERATYIEGVTTTEIDGMIGIDGFEITLEEGLEPYEPKDNEFYWVEGNSTGSYVVCGDYSIFSCSNDDEPCFETTRETSFFRKLHTRRPATPTEKDYLIKAVEEEYGKTYNEETKQWEDMVVEWTPQPFERVLVRDNDFCTTWNADLYSFMDKNTYYCVGSSWDQVIPYKGNEALLGTTDECKTKYKIK